MIDKYINDLRTIILKYDNGSLFDNVYSLDKELIKICEDILKDNMYMIVPPTNSNFTPNNIEDVIEYFYIKAKNNNVKTCGMLYNKSKDLSIMVKFIESYIECNNISYTRALNDTILIIDTLFENIHEFSFNKPIGIWVFGLNKCKWITDYIIHIINNNYIIKNDAIINNMAMLDEINDHTYCGFDFNSLRGIYEEKD